MNNVAHPDGTACCARGFADPLERSGEPTGKISVIRANQGWVKLSSRGLEGQIIATPGSCESTHMRTDGILYWLATA